MIERFSAIAKDNKEIQLRAAQADLEETTARLARAEELLSLFEFPGWDQFRQKYIVGIRLPALYKAAASSLNKEEVVRYILCGQIEEAVSLSKSKEDIEIDIDNLRKKAQKLSQIIEKALKTGKYGEK